MVSMVKSIKEELKKRTAEFFTEKDWKGLFSELCFCVLTANGSAEKGLEIQKDLGPAGFLKLSEKELVKELKKHGYRFPNTRAKYIVENREKAPLLPQVYDMNPKEAREWLVKNFKGIGYKEASHFLRNVGVFDLAILDKHVLRWMKKNKLISDIPRSLSKQQYLEIEKKFVKEAKEKGMSPGIFDLVVWAEMTGKVMK